MTAPKDLPYSITGRELVHESDGLRVQILSLAEGESVPWHYHTSISDVFVGQHGVTVVESRAPRGRYEIGPGEHCVIPPLTAHEVTGKDGQACQFTIIQGVGEHDFVAVGSGEHYDDD